MLEAAMTALPDPVPVRVAILVTAGPAAALGDVDGGRNAGAGGAAGQLWRREGSGACSAEGVVLEVRWGLGGVGCGRDEGR